MTEPPRSRRLRAALRCVTAASVAVVLVTGCASGDRPARAEWARRWDEVQQLVPTEQELLADGQTFCDELLGRLRTELADLEPTPSEAVDAAVASWSEHLRTLAFECPSEPSEIDDALAPIHRFEVEIAAVLDDAG